MARTSTYVVQSIYTDLGIRIAVSADVNPKAILSEPRSEIGGTVYVNGYSSLTITLTDDNVFFKINAIEKNVFVSNILNAALAVKNLFCLHPTQVLHIPENVSVPILENNRNILMLRPEIIGDGVKGFRLHIGNNIHSGHVLSGTQLRALVDLLKNIDLHLYAMQMKTLYLMNNILK